MLDCEITTKKEINELFHSTRAKIIWIAIQIFGKVRIFIRRYKPRVAVKQRDHEALVYVMTRANVIRKSKECSEH